MIDPKKKWAFVSDYARFWILYNYGGLYFDTDVEVIKDMSEIIKRGAFMGCEAENTCNPGLGLGVAPGHRLYKMILEYYSKLHFINQDGSINEHTVVEYITEILRKYGFVNGDEIQFVAEIYIYPKEYFCPLDYSTGKLNITKKTVSIHHYAASWHSILDDWIVKIERSKSKSPIEMKIRRGISLPFRAANKIQKNGLKNTLKFIEHKAK